MGPLLVGAACATLQSMLMTMWRRSSIVLVAMGPTVVVVGCSYDWTFTDPSSKSDAGRGTVEDGAVNEPDVLNPKGPPKPRAACAVSKDCPVESFCHFDDGLCGNPLRGGLTTGTCVEIDLVCSETVPGTCSCDGTSVETACQAAKQTRSDLDLTGKGCVASVFKCPGVAAGCKVNAEYCLVKEAAPNNGNCVAYAMCKEAPVCGCEDLPKAPCNCSEQGGGALMISCPG
jgi:hypothetical protein